jgi:hypothetical protein
MNQPTPTPPFDWGVWTRDVIEKIWTTFLQFGTPLIVLIFTSGKTDPKAFIAVVVPPIASVIMTQIGFLNPTFPSYWQDVIFRLVRTEIGIVLALVGASAADLYSATWWQSVLVAAVTGVGVFIKAEVAKYLASKRPPVYKTGMEPVSPASLALKPAA